MENDEVKDDRGGILVVPCKAHVSIRLLYINSVSTQTSCGPWRAQVWVGFVVVVDGAEAGSKLGYVSQTRGGNSSAGGR
jgi:hypothetical protein